jgi:hypothetical protein
MRAAARAGDMERLGTYADAQAITLQARADTLDAFEETIHDPQMQSTEGRRRLVAFAKRQIAQSQKWHFLPDHVRPWLAELQLSFSGRAKDSENPYIEHRGLNEFLVRYPCNCEEPDLKPLLTFRRHGLGWKLEAVRFGQQ